MLKKLSFTILLLLFISPLAAWAGEFYQAGEQLPELPFEDQFENSTPLNSQDRLILFSREMASKDVIQAVVKAKGDDVLSKNHVAYASDISGMPRFIANMMAIPKMQKYPYKLHLDRSGDLAEKFPFQDGKITLIFIKDLKIEKIEFKTTADEISQAIDSL